MEDLQKLVNGQRLSEYTEALKQYYSTLSANNVFTDDGESVGDVISTLAKEGILKEPLMDSEGNVILTSTGEQINTTALFGAKMAEVLKNDYDNQFSQVDAKFDEADDKFNQMIVKFDNEVGAKLGLSIDPSTYVMTISLISANDTVLDTKTVDLPLETMVVNASCSGTTLTLTLQNGTTVDVNVSSIISGLVPTSRKIVGIDLADDITRRELKNAIDVLVKEGSYLSDVSLKDNILTITQEEVSSNLDGVSLANKVYINNQLLSKTVFILNDILNKIQNLEKIAANAILFTDSTN